MGPVPRPLPLAACCLPIVVWLAIAASPAAAFPITMAMRGGPVALQVSDTFAVDVFVGVDELFSVADFSVAVLFDSGSLSYDPVASAALPVIHPAPAFYTTGAQPGYLFYSQSDGLLYPTPTPAFQEWPTPPPGQGQVNVSFDFVGDPTIGGGTRTETYSNSIHAVGGAVWIGSVVFHLDTDATSSIALSVTAGGAGIEETTGVLYDPSEISLGAPILVPESTSGLLVAVAVLTGLALGYSRTFARRRSTTSPSTPVDAR